MTGLFYVYLCFSSTPVSPGHLLALEPILAQDGDNQELSCLGQSIGPMIKFLVLCVYSCAFLLVIWSSWPLAACITFLKLFLICIPCFWPINFDFIVHFTFAYLSNFLFIVLGLHIYILRHPIWIMLTKSWFTKPQPMNYKHPWAWYWLNYFQYGYSWIWWSKNVYMIKHR